MLGDLPDRTIIIDGGTQNTNGTATIAAIVKRFPSAQMLRHPAGANSRGYSVVRIRVCAHSGCQSSIDAAEIREELRKARVPGFFRYCDNCYMADLAVEIGEPPNVRPCGCPGECIGRQRRQEARDCGGADAAQSH